MAGVQMAWGGGTPGPLFLTAIAAGIWAGPIAGLIIGTATGLCAAMLNGKAFMLIALLTMACATAAGYLPRIFSRKHLLVGMLAAFVASFLASITLGALAAQPISALLWFAVRRGGVNSLWMIPIYGIVLVVSMLRAATRDRGEI